MSQNDVVRTPLRVTNRAGDVLQADVRAPRGASGLPLVVICHSFMAFKEWGFFPRVAERIAAAGFVSVAFNFSRNGVAGDGVRITDFERFASNTFSCEHDDLRAMIDALTGGAVGPAADPRRLALLGHSRGGGVAVLEASTDERVRALVTWSAIATFARWTEHQKERWRAHGSLPLAKESTVSPLRLGIGLLEDLERNAESLDLLRAAARFRRPWLIVHGREDVTVPVREAEALYGAADAATTTLRVLEHVGHLYHAATEAEDQYRTLDGIIDASTRWLHQTLT